MQFLEGLGEKLCVNVRAKLSLFTTYGRIQSFQSHAVPASAFKKARIEFRHYAFLITRNKKLVVHRLVVLKNRSNILLLAYLSSAFDYKTGTGCLL